MEGRDLMAHFTKPEAGSWTEHYPELGTGPVSYEDSINPEHYELERKAIFGRTWLNVGRVEQLSRNGTYFTKELDAAGTSVIVVNGPPGHRPGVPQHLPPPGQQARLAGLPPRGDERRLPPVHLQVPRLALRPRGRAHLRPAGVGVLRPRQPRSTASRPCSASDWEGFIFVNLDPDNTTSLRDYLGPMGAGVEGWPFGEMTQVYKYRANVGANWKLFIDAFAEFYHAPILHAKQAVADESSKLAGYGYEALAYDIHGPHSMVSSWGGMAPPKDPNMVKPIERVLRSGIFGPWDRPDIEGLDDLPPGINPSRHRAWGVDSFVFFPNFMLLVWAPGWYLTYHYWPTSYNSHIFEGTLYFVPPKDADGAARAGARRRDVQGVRPAGRQHARGHAVDARVASGDASSRSTTRRSSSGTSTRPHATTSTTTCRAARRRCGSPRRPERRDEMSTVLPTEFADLEPFADWALETEAERYAKRLASSMDELQAFYDAAFPRLEPPWRTSMPSTSRPCRRTPPGSCGSATRW